MVARNREQWPFQLMFGFGNEISDAFVRVPEVSQDTQLMLGEAGTNRIRLHDVGIEPFLLHVDAVRRMIRRAHDQVKAGLWSGVLEDKTKKGFVVYAPLISASARSHLIAAVN